MIDEHERQQQLEHARMLGDAAADGFLDRLGGDEGIGAIIATAMIGSQPQTADRSVEAALAAIETLDSRDLLRVSTVIAVRMDWLRRRGQVDG